MEIIGSGFLARHLAVLETDHPHVTALAAGVSRTIDVGQSAYQREAALLYETIDDCRRLDRTLLFFSTASASMYGGVGAPGREDGPVYPQSPYGHHKLALETVVRLSGVRHLILRLGHVLGPDQPAHQMLPILIGAVRSGRVEVHRGACRDLIDVADVVSAVDALLRADALDEVVNVASGVAVPAESIVDHLELRLGGPLERRFVDRSSRYEVSLDKLSELTRGKAGQPFPEDYYKGVIDACLESAPGS
ncbi:NAD-dependent epimerase/dehydratase family protein [Streptomyces sp. NPDC050504]|uniref:NAD-dependent epimerase/dehydratase family protein n=1 Tax=Streptomyces sp. NPDC050504 TaxID=3365618 RepID=UPI0037AE0F70